MSKHQAQSERSDDQPVKTAEVKRLYQRPPSFTDLLPWAEYLPESRAFLLEDGISVGALFELEPVGTEARTPRFMAELRDAIQTALTDAIPERDGAPWILQVYVQDTPSLTAFTRAVTDYARPEARDSTFTRHFQQTLAEHLERISRPGGLFTDAAVTGTRWRGQIRRVRAVLYRRIRGRGRVPPAVEVEADLNDVATKWVAALASAGIKSRRGTGHGKTVLPQLRGRRSRPRIGIVGHAQIVENAPDIAGQSVDRGGIAVAALGLDQSGGETAQAGDVFRTVSGA